MNIASRILPGAAAGARLRRWLRRGLGVAVACMAGALAYLTLGDGPHTATARAPAPVDWRLPTPVASDPARADIVWAERAPWGAPPKPKEELPPPPPPPVPVGVVAVGRGFQAVFVVPGAAEVRVGAGDALPGGGRVVAVERFHVKWTDPQGELHERELLSDPLPPLDANGRH